jgi:hypothetical protein
MKRPVPPPTAPTLGALSPPPAVSPASRRGSGSRPVPHVCPTEVSHGWFWGLYSGGTSPTIACDILIPAIRSALSPGENAAGNHGLATWRAGTT